MLSCIFDDDPVPVHREHADLLEPGRRAGAEGERIPLGKAVVRVAGSDVTLISYSRSVHDCAGRCRQLAEERRIEVELIDLRTIVAARRGDAVRSRWPRHGAPWSCTRR